MLQQYTQISTLLSQNTTTITHISAHYSTTQSCIPHQIRVCSKSNCKVFSTQLPCSLQTLRVCVELNLISHPIFFLVFFLQRHVPLQLHGAAHHARPNTLKLDSVQTERISPHHSNAHTHNGRVKIRVSEVLLTLNQHNYAPFRFPRLSTSVSSVVETVVVVFVVLSVCSSLVVEMLENFS